MSRVCTICSNSQRQAIDTALVAGEPYRGIARSYGVSEDAVERHQRAGHIIEKIVKKANLKEMLEADDLLGQARTLQEQAFSVLAEATGQRDEKGNIIAPRNPAMMLKAMREAREGVRLIGEVIGKLRPQGDSAAPPTVLVLRLSDNGRGLAPPANAIVERESKNGNGNGAARRR